MAAVKALQDMGINVELKENCKPRCYYNNQIQRQVIDLMDTDNKAAAKEASADLDFNEDADVCDFVIHCPEAYYDVGLIRHKDGYYVPFFDDYEHSPRDTPQFKTGKESGGIKKVLGSGQGRHAGHWNGLRESSEQANHSIGKFLQEYTKSVVSSSAVSSGQSIESCEFDAETGEYHMVLSVD